MADSDLATNVDEETVFEIGLVMAGAISAGAYTAGVIDFLIEALEAWEEARKRPEYDGPTHRVRLAVMSGASAGSMTTAIAAIALSGEIDPVRDVTAPPLPQRNRLFDSWVNRIHIDELLGNRDLRDADGRSRPVVSVLDSTVLDEIATDALHIEQRTGRRAYVADPLPVFLTVANLRGVPYGFQFGGADPNYSHQMTQHADHMMFNVSWTGYGTPNGITLDASNVHAGDCWLTLRDAALASGAFPLGLAPRRLVRRRSEYAGRQWDIPNDMPLQDGACICTTTATIQPHWPEGIGSDYEFFNVDGGLINNEPLELARRHLATQGRNDRSGEKARRAVIMIDPFPNDSPVEAKPVREPTLLNVIPAMFSALKRQARFKPDELMLAQRDDVHSRFVVAPTRTEANGRATEPAIAAAVLGGFGGFFSRAYREHDFQLGRRNCQRFLHQWFVLPDTNSLFEPWRKADPAAAEERRIKEDDGSIMIDTEGPYLPIIPLVGDLHPAAPNGPVPHPKRPSAADAEPTLRILIKARLGGIVPGLIANVEACWIRAALKILWRGAVIIGLRRKLVESVASKVEVELSKLSPSSSPPSA